MSVDLNETDVSEVVAELVSVVSEERNDSIPQSIPADEQQPDELAIDSSESNVHGSDQADMNEADSSEEVVQSPSSDDQGSGAEVTGNEAALTEPSSDEQVSGAEVSQNEATLTENGMANMITDTTSSESATEESEAAKDSTNAAFEDFLERSTAAKTEATEAYKQSDLATARLKYMTALELLQVS